MKKLQDQVCRLLFREKLSSTATAERLGITPGEVVHLAVSSRKKGFSGNPADPPAPLVNPPLSDTEEIGLLRKKVRGILLDRVEDFPPTNLVRLWQLVEDSSLLGPSSREQDDPFEIPEEITEKVFELLDGA